MGRFDKIRVYNGSSWQQPSRIRVFSNNAWQDLGSNDSTNTRPLYVRYNNAWARATLNKTTVTVPGESYAAGDGFRLLPANGFCYCSNSNNSVNVSWFFRATIRKTWDGDNQIFWTGNSSGTCAHQIIWLNDGRIQVRTKSQYGSGNWTTITTSNAVGKNQWVYLNVTCNKDVGTMSIYFNGVTTSGQNWQTFQINAADNWVGGSGIEFKDGLECQGSKWQNQSTYRWINMTTASGSSNEWEGIDHVDTSYTETRWT